MSEPETAAELERLRQQRAQMGLRIFVAEKELKKIALNHAEPARSGVVAAIGALNGDFPNGTKGTELEIDRLRETSRELVETRRPLLRELVDEAWNECTESLTVPSTEWADRVIDRVLARAGVTQ